MRIKIYVLAEVFKDLNKLKKVKTQKEKTERKKNVYNKASELYNDFLGICFGEYYELADDKRDKVKHKYYPKKLFLKTCNYDYWFENEELYDTTQKSKKGELSDPTKTDEKSTDLPPIPALEHDDDEEEVKEEKRLKILAPNKLLTILPILLAQIKAGNNSNKLKNEIRQILYLLYQHNKITKKVYNNLVKSL